MKGTKKKVSSVGFGNFLCKWSMVCNGEQNFRKYKQRVRSIREKEVEHHAINVN